MLRNTEGDRMKPLVYLASPYSEGDRYLNVVAHLIMYRRLLQDGIVNPVAPLLATLMPGADQIPYERWIEVDLSIVERCDALLSFDAQVDSYSYIYSEGRRKEVSMAEECNIPVFRFVDLLYEWAKRQ